MNEIKEKLEQEIGKYHDKILKLNHSIETCDKLGYETQKKQDIKIRDEFLNIYHLFLDFEKVMDNLENDNIKE